MSHIFNGLTILAALMLVYAIGTSFSLEEIFLGHPELWSATLGALVGGLATHLSSRWKWTQDLEVEAQRNAELERAHADSVRCKLNHCLNAIKIFRKHLKKAEIEDIKNPIEVVRKFMHAPTYAPDLKISDDELRALRSILGRDQQFEFSALQIQYGIFEVGFNGYIERRQEFLLRFPNLYYDSIPDDEIINGGHGEYLSYLNNVFTYFQRAQMSMYELEQMILKKHDLISRRALEGTS